MCGQNQMQQLLETSPETSSIPIRASPGSSTARSSPSRQRERTSPYPQRIRTPTRISPEAIPPRARIQEQRYRLVLRPIVKATIGQRDTSAATLEDAIFTGNSFDDILPKIWEQFKSHVKCRAVKADGVWSVEGVEAAEWSRVMQFKVKKHLVESYKSADEWNKWLHKVSLETVLLMICTYGMAITKAQDLDEFTEACIQPTQTDRAGATAEVSLRDVVSKLRDKWGSTFRAEAVVWRMWANEVTRTLDRSTWEAGISKPPPPRTPYTSCTISQRGPRLR
ncbi:hypothetical protein AC1031_014909 [Aphanomyces cochlioides]|nr:hypothetical protein AC1031_014909 [Aphanomyces cochlioides]